MANSSIVALALDLQWPYKRHADIFAGTQIYAQEHHWTTVIDEFPAESLSNQRPTEILYDGVIARASEKLVQQADRHKIPVVNVWLSSPARERTAGVFSDFAAGGRLIADHLLVRGLRQFAATHIQEDYAAKQEFEAFHQTVQNAGFDCLSVQVPLDPADDYELQLQTETKLLAWMDEWQLPIGVCVYSDHLGRLVTQLCLRRGWRVPEDVAIVAGSNEEILCNRPRPSLTSLEHGYERVGYKAAELLDELLEIPPSQSRSELPARHIFVPPHGLVVRESTDFLAVTDELVAAAMTFISKNCHKTIGQEDVAQAVSTGTRTLQRRFRNTLDRSVAAMIRHVRLERAKQHLAQSDRRIKDIAREVGFGQPMRMYDAFRRELGVTPTEYRSQQEKRTHE